MIVAVEPRVVEGVEQLRRSLYAHTFQTLPTRVLHPAARMMQNLVISVMMAGCWHNRTHGTLSVEPVESVGCVTQILS